MSGAALVQFGTAAGSAATTMATGFLKMLEAAVEKGTAATSASAGEAQSTATGLSENLDPTALRDRLASLLATFRDCVDGVLSDHGVPFDQGLRINQSETGMLSVASDASQSGAASEALNSSPVLKDLFSAIVQTSRKLQVSLTGDPATTPTRPMQLLVSRDGATSF